MKNTDAAGPKGKWWSRNRGIDPAVYDSFATSLAAQPGRPHRILAWTHTPDGVCVGTPSALSVSTPTGWTHLGWHEIEKGDWNADTQTLRWALYGGKRGSVVLAEPGRMPELFRERVSASIVLEHFVPIVGTRGVIVSARRDLGDPLKDIDWHATLTRGLSWDTAGVAAAAEHAVAELRTEYDSR